MCCLIVQLKCEKSQAWQALIANDVPVPCVNVLQHPRVHDYPPVLVTPDVHINNVYLHHTRRQRVNKKHPPGGQVDSVAAVIWYIREGS